VTHLPGPIHSAQRLGYGLGLALCLGTPGLIAGLILARVVPAGNQAPEGVFQQLGYLFSGLVFLSAAWVWWRSGRLLRGFRAVPEALRPGVVLRESLVYAAAFEASSLCGLVYWALVGVHAARHAWGFVLLTPLLFLVLVPRADRWKKALEP
jgi:hypothetical protein